MEIIINENLRVTFADAPVNTPIATKYVDKSGDVMYITEDDIKYAYEITNISCDSANRQYVIYYTKYILNSENQPVSNEYLVNVVNDDFNYTYFRELSLANTLEKGIIKLSHALLIGSFNGISLKHHLYQVFPD